MTDTDHVSKVAELIGDFRIGMLTTHDESGDIEAHPMRVQETEFDGDLWFLLSDESGPARNLRGDQRAAVVFASNDTWLSLKGSAQVVPSRDKVRELWSAEAEAWFPEGPEDPHASVVKFTAEGAEYWDTPGGRVASVFSFVKSKVTGDTLDADNAKVDL